MFQPHAAYFFGQGGAVAGGDRLGLCRFDEVFGTLSTAAGPRRTASRGTGRDLPNFAADNHGWVKIVVRKLGQDTRQSEWLTQRLVRSAHRQVDLSPARAILSVGYVQDRRQAYPISIVPYPIRRIPHLPVGSLASLSLRREQSGSSSKRDCTTTSVCPKDIEHGITKIATSN